MRLTIKVKTTGADAYEVETNLFAIIAWERKYRTKASELAKGVGMEDLAYLAYEASKHRGITVPAVFDDFVKRLEELEVLTSGDTDPTQKEPSDDSSPSFS